MYLIDQVKRIDFNLRASYPDLVTTIVQCAVDKFVIHCQSSVANFKVIERYFQHSICPVTLLAVISLALELPAVQQEIIPNLADEDIAKNFAGITQTAATLLNLLLAKFPAVPFSEVKRVDDRIQVVTTTYEEKLGDTTKHHYLTQADKLRVDAFLSGLSLGLPHELVEIPGLGPDAVQMEADFNPVRYIYAANAKRSLAAPYELRDEALWYDNIDRIFSGSISKDDLYFVDSAAYTCYVDYSFGNIDLRNHLLLFERVYVTPPYGDHGQRDLTAWLRDLNITKSEFLSLLINNRVKLVLSQPSFRYDQSFVREVYEACPEAIITRRALATLLQIDLVELADNYLLNDPQSLPELRAFSELLSDKLQLDATYLYESLSWPIKARRKSFEALDANGIYSTAAFGVNNFLGAFIKRATGRDLEMEFSVSAANIHLSNALNATYFQHASPNIGFNDQVFASIMGETLNFYKTATTSQFKAMLNSKQLVESGVMPIDPITVFDINSYIPIDELEQALRHDAAHTGSKRLIETLAALSPEQRKQKIAYYNQQVQERRNQKLTATWQLDLGVNVGLDAASLVSGAPFLGTLYWAVKKATGLAGKLPLIKHTLDKLEEAIHGPGPDQRNINYLTQINRVARLHRWQQ